MISQFSSASKDTISAHNTPIIISNRQWLALHWQELPNIDILIIDECHQIKASNQIKRLVQRSKIYSIFGFTGTLPEEKIDQWATIGICGPVLLVKTPIELQNRDILAGTNIASIRFDHKKQSPKPIQTFVDPYEYNKLII